MVCVYYSKKNTAFTSFSVALGSMVAEIHKCLCLSLNERSIPVLTQCLKCMAALIQVTPYHRMTHGLISKIIRNVKPCINHKGSK